MLSSGYIGRRTFRKSKRLLSEVVTPSPSHVIVFLASCSKDDDSARKLMLASFAYLPIMQIVFVIDRFLA